MALVFWDYDGVLVDSAEIEKKYYIAACRKAGVEQIRTYEDVATLCEGNFYQECLKSGIDSQKLELSLEIFEKLIYEAACQYDFFPGMREIVMEVALRYPSYIITSNSSALVADSLKHHRIEGIREILGADRDKSKVKKINYVKALFPREKTCFIGDTSGDILEAQASGVDVTIGVTWGWHKAAVLSASRPDYIFSTVFELGDFLCSVI